MDIEQMPSVKNAISSSCREAGRDPASVHLVAVSKGQDTTKIHALSSLGQLWFGGNDASELLQKAASLPNVRWSFIGALQSNKIAKIMSVASEIQTLASEKHVRYAARYSRELNKPKFPVYIEVNAGEEQKAGIPLAQAEAFARFVEEEGGDALALQGIMCVPPEAYDDDWLTKNDAVPELYAHLRQTADKIGAGHLSLGMSHDLHLAIRAGSDVVRIGTALFGPRPGH